MKFAIRRAGVIKDYEIFPREPHQTNIFGRGPTGQLGEIDTEVGFTDLKNRVYANQYVIGQQLLLRILLIGLIN